MLVFVQMPARVPAVRRHVDPAAEREPVVDHHDLVMMAGADRVGPVQLEVDLAVGRPPCEAQDGRPAPEQLDGSDVPLEDVDLQPRPVFRQP